MFFKLLLFIFYCFQNIQALYFVPKMRIKKKKQSQLPLLNFETELLLTKIFWTTKKKRKEKRRRKN